jgi:hypothetical protein
MTEDAFNFAKKITKMTPAATSLNRKRQTQDLNPYRNQVIEEVAQEVEKMTGFGKDTIDSFSIYIRSLKA